MRSCYQNGAVVHYKPTTHDDDADNDDVVDDVVKAQGLSRVSSNNATLTRALSAESLLSQTTVSSPKFNHGQFHIHDDFYSPNCNAPRRADFRNHFSTSLTLTFA